MKENLMTAEEVLADAKLYASPPVYRAIEESFKKTGKMPSVVLRDLELEEVIRYKLKKGKLDIQESCDTVSNI